ncbi:MAG: hypothetical protein GY950_03235 [bacterium]|nr:hypothetical protein [bacterium]
MGSYEENVLYKDEFFRELTSQKPFQRSKKKKKTRQKNIDAMGMYETLTGHELIDARNFFQSLENVKSSQFEDFIERLGLLKETNRMEVKLKTMI